MVIGIIIGAIILVLISWAVAYSVCFIRPTPSEAFVRSGKGGEVVAKGAGIYCFPVIHKKQRVPLDPIQLRILKKEEDAFHTHDCYKVDMEAVFSIRVKSEDNSIKAAAKTLSPLFNDEEAMGQFIQPKLVAALRSVTATKDLQTLFRERETFENAIEEAVSKNIGENGLECETVSLVDFGQTGGEFYREGDVFDEQGLKNIVEKTETLRKERNDIEKTTEVEIKTRDLSAHQEKLGLERQEEEATLKQEQELALERAKQKTEIENAQAEQDKLAELARVEAERAKEEAFIAKENSIKLAQVEKNNQLQAEQLKKAKEIEELQVQNTKAIEIAKIEKDREIEELEIQKARSIEVAAIQREEAEEIAKQDKAIKLAKKSEEQSAADAAANRAQVEAIEEEEKVTTVQLVAQAERDKEVELINVAKDSETKKLTAEAKAAEERINAKAEAEKEAVKVTVTAAAEKQAAEDRAEALTIEAKAKSDADIAEAKGVADKRLTVAKADAEATKLEADAIESKLFAEAAGAAKKAEAENKISVDRLDADVKRDLIARLPEIMAQYVKPFEQVKDIRLIKAEGLQGLVPNSGGGGSPSSKGGQAAAAPTGGGNFAQQIFHAADEFKLRSALTDTLLNSLGLQGCEPSDISNLLNKKRPISSPKPESGSTVG